MKNWIMALAIGVAMLSAPSGYADAATPDDIGSVPSVDFSSALDPAHPAVKQSFRLAAAAFPRNGVDILSVTGYVKYTKSGRFTALPMADEGAGNWCSEMQPGRNGGESIYSYATVWYGGAGVVPGNPDYAVSNLSSSVTTVTVSSVKSGEVWINELSCARLAPGNDATDDGGGRVNQDHEFVEICGMAGTGIANWKIQLAYALPEDIAANSGQAVYATYGIPSGTKIPDDGSGYGFWLLADSSVDGCDLPLSTPEPLAAAESGGELRRSHIRDAAGVIRLVDQYGGVIHSVSYGADADGAERLPVAPNADPDNTATIALAGTGSLYPDFAWALATPTPGIVNGSQALRFPAIVINALGFADDGSIVLETEGNAGGHFTDFRVLATSNLLLDVSAWDQPAFTRTGFGETSTFTLPDPPSAPARYFAIQPLP